MHFNSNKNTYRYRAKTNQNKIYINGILKKTIKIKAIYMRK